MESSATSHISNLLHVLCVFDKLIQSFPTAKRKAEHKDWTDNLEFTQLQQQCEGNVNSKSSFVRFQVFCNYSIPIPLFNITGEANSPYVGALISINWWKQPSPGSYF